MSNSEIMEITQAEINALLKMLDFIKFECTDDEADIYAASPLINSIMKKAIELSYFSKHIKQNYEQGIPENTERTIRNRINKRQATYIQKINENDFSKNLAEALFPYAISKNIDLIKQYLSMNKDKISKNFLN